MYKITFVKKYTEALYLGRYCPVTAHEITNAIGWLWKFRHITKAQMQYFCDLMTAYFECRDFDGYDHSMHI